MPIFASYGSCAYKNSSAKFKKKYSNISIWNHCMTTKNCKNVKFWEYMECFSFNNTWKKENWPELQKKTYKTLHNTTFFPGMTSVLQKNITRSKQNIPHLLTSDIDGFLLKKIIWCWILRKKYFGWDGYRKKYSDSIFAI